MLAKDAKDDTCCERREITRGLDR